MTFTVTWRHALVAALLAIGLYGVSTAQQDARATSHEVCDQYESNGHMTRDGWDGDTWCVASHRERGPDVHAIISDAILAGAALVAAGFTAFWPRATA